MVSVNFLTLLIFAVHKLYFQNPERLLKKLWQQYLNDYANLLLNILESDSVNWYNKAKNMTDEECNLHASKYICAHEDLLTLIEIGKRRSFSKIETSYLNVLSASLLPNLSELAVAKFKESAIKLNNQINLETKELES
jgi:hypothetical protein